LVREPVAGTARLLRVHAANGQELDASFRLEFVGDAITLIFESRGGTRGSAEERNSDYATGLELLLSRIGSLGLRIADILVESRDTAALEPAQRRVVIEGEPFPLVIGDAARLRQKISAAQARVGRVEGARGGGNRTKRLRIFIDGAEESVSPSDLAERLARDDAPPG
jgi:hypothetical protein